MRSSTSWRCSLHNGKGMLVEQLFAKGIILPIRKIICNVFIHRAGNGMHLPSPCDKRTYMSKLAIGEAIRALRLAKGLSLTDLEKLTGMDNGSLSKIERGKRNLTNHSMQVIAAGLGVSLSDLFAKHQPLSDVKMPPRKDNLLPQKSGGYSDHRVDNFSELKLIPEGFNVVIDCVKAVPRSESSRGWMKDPTAAITFLSDCLRTLDSKPENLVSHRIKDDTMLPRLCSGDCLAIDTGETDIPDNGGVFAVIFDTRTVSIRRIYFKPGGGLLIVCDNDRFPAMTLSAKEAKNMAIVGRIKVLQSVAGF